MARKSGGSESRDEVYSRALTSKQAAVFAAASGDIGLENEIKLIRTLISMLGRNLGAHAATILRGMTVLCRIVEIQRRAGTDTSELERVLLEAAEEALQGLQGLEEDLEAAERSVDPTPASGAGEDRDALV